MAIEPNPTDSEILKRNCPSSLLLNYAIAADDSTMEFFIETSGGNSSLVKPRTFDQIKLDDVVRLDSLLVEHGLQKVKLLKIEEEGYEPEVLRGCESFLNKIEYIAVDSSYERGINEDLTFTHIVNILLSNGFEDVDVYFQWQLALFKNKFF